MEDKDFEEWVKEETLKRISEFKKENPKLFPNGETNNKWDKYIEWSVRTKERGFRAGVEFGKKENKVELKSYRETVDAMVTENEEWLKKVDALRRFLEKWYGKRCKDYVKECSVCELWKEFDRILFGKVKKE